MDILIVAVRRLSIPYVEGYLENSTSEPQPYL